MSYEIVPMKKEKETLFCVCTFLCGVCIHPRKLEMIHKKLFKMLILDTGNEESG